MKTKPTLALPVATVLVLLSASAMAQVTFYTSKAAFDAAASTTLLEDFEAFSPKNANLGTFTLHGLTYTSLNSYHLWVDGPGYTTWGAGCPIPNATSILVANGDEDFTAAFSTPPSALGFDTYLNGLGPATVKVRLVMGRVPSAGLELLRSMVTVVVGLLVSTTMNEALPPLDSSELEAQAALDLEQAASDTLLDAAIRLRE